MWCIGNHKNMKKLFQFSTFSGRHTIETREGNTPIPLFREEKEYFIQNMGKYLTKDALEELEKALQVSGVTVEIYVTGFTPATTYISSAVASRMNNNQRLFLMHWDNVYKEYTGQQVFPALGLPCVDDLDVEREFYNPE